MTRFRRIRREMVAFTVRNNQTENEDFFAVPNPRRLPNDIQEGIQDLWFLCRFFAGSGSSHQNRGVSGMDSSYHSDAQDCSQNSGGEVIAERSGSHLAWGARV